MVGGSKEMRKIANSELEYDKKCLPPSETYKMYLPDDHELFKDREAEQSDGWLHPLRWCVAILQNNVDPYVRVLYTVSARFSRP